MIVRPIAKGAAKRAATKDARHAWLAQSIGRLDDAEKKTLDEAGRIMRRLVGM